MFHNIKSMIRILQTPVAGKTASALRDEIVEKQNSGRLLPQRNDSQPTNERGLAQKEEPSQEG